MKSLKFLPASFAALLATGVSAHAEKGYIPTLYQIVEKPIAELLETGWSIQHTLGDDKLILSNGSGGQTILCTVKHPKWGKHPAENLESRCALIDSK